MPPTQRTTMEIRATGSFLCYPWCWCACHGIFILMYVISFYRTCCFKCPCICITCRNKSIYLQILTNVTEVCVLKFV